MSDYRPPRETYSTRDRSRRSSAAPTHQRRSAAPPPRRASVGHPRRKRRSPVAAILGVLVLVAIVGGAAAWWVLTRPASLTLTANPTDAIISVVDVKEATGTVEAKDLKPGAYQVTVARSGFETATATLQLTRGHRTRQSFDLTPLPQTVTLTTRPVGAKVSITRGAETTSAATPCTLSIASGDISISIEMDGYNTFTKALFLDHAETLDLLLDPKGQLVHALGSITAAGAPKGVRLTPDGKEAWSAILNGPPSIQIFDPATGANVGNIDLGASGAVEVDFNSTGTLAYASQMETKIGETSRVYEIDVATRQVLRTLDTKSTMTKVIVLSPDDTMLYTANWAGNDVSIIDLASGKVVKRVPVSKTPRGLYPTRDGKYLYVAGFGTGDLGKIDLASGKYTKLFSSGGAMRHLIADETTGRLYASDMAKDAIWLLDMKTDQVTKLCSTDHKPNTIDLSPDGKVLFVSNRGANNPKSYYLPGYEWGSILLLDAATGKPLDAIVGGNQCTALDVSSDGKMLVFSDFLDNRLRVYEVPSYETLAGGNGGRYEAHFVDIKKSSPGTSASTGAAD
ncbi:MAG: PEGA domain-containing protein [Coriobacteriia bacterium]